MCYTAPEVSVPAGCGFVSLCVLRISRSSVYAFSLCNHANFETVSESMGKAVVGYGVELRGMRKGLCSFDLRLCIGRRLCTGKIEEILFFSF